MAGNHGDEYEGQVALGRLIRELDPAEVQGRIIILPSANFPAAMAGSRTSPLDQGNLNRSFPGDPTGGPTAQIAYYIEHEPLAGGGQVTPAALRIAEGGVRRVLHALGVLTREPPRAEHTTRLMQLSGQDYYCYAPEPGLFEPLVELGAEIETGAAAGAIHPHD